MERVKLHIATYTDSNTHGNLFGYHIMASKLREYVSKIAELSSDSNNVLFMATPEVFKPGPEYDGKTIFLFTMFEGLDIPNVYLENMEKAHYLITPSTWVKELFSKYFDSNKIFVVPLGVEPVFRYHKRNTYPKHFRFLWVGAPNPRKGFAELTTIWQTLGLDKKPEMELYLKTTKVPNVDIQQCRNVILDARRLETWELVSLYNSAHCFVFPTHGEGFGLTILEAMATGLPCIATGFSGHTEFFDDKVGYPISYEFKESNIMSAIHGNMGGIRVAFPDVKEFAEKMLWVRLNYKKALIKGKIASIRAHRDFSWQRSAQELVRVINRVNGGN